LAHPYHGLDIFRDHGRVRLSVISFAKKQKDATTILCAGHTCIRYYEEMLFNKRSCLIEANSAQVAEINQFNL